jgi:hypothetical protein
MLYVENGDVDVYTLVKKKPKSKIGDGKVDPSAREDFQGAMIIQLKSEMSLVVADTGKKFMKLKTKSYMTTGTASLVVSGSKTALDGLRMPDDDISGLLTGALRGPAGSLQGQPIDLDAGTGTLVGTQGFIKGKTALGRSDSITVQVWVLNIKG